MSRRAARAALFAGCAACALAAAPGRARAFTWVQEVTEIARETLRAGQVVKQLDEARAMVREGEKIVGQGERAYRAVTGVRDLGSAMYALDLLGVQNPLPPDAPAVLDMLSGRRGGFGVLDGLHRTARAANRIFDPRDGSFRGDEMAANADSVAAMQAVAARTYEANAQRLDRLADVRARARAASDPKEVADLTLAVDLVRADIASQQAQLQSAHLMFVGAQAARAQRTDEYEARCLALVVAYFRQDGRGGSLDCPENAAPPAGGNVRLVAGAAVGRYPSGAAGSGGDPLDAMLAQPWGEQAAENARRAGIQPAALAAACVIESNCQAAAAAPTSSAAGPFQFVRDTWREQAGRAGVSTDLDARFDGVASSAAAANYFSEHGQRLQQYGIDTPSLGQAYALYQLGGPGLNVATAPDNALVSTVAPSLSPAAMSNNNIVPGVTTVGQWRDRYRAKVGAAFDGPLFLPSNT